MVTEQNVHDKLVEEAKRLGGHRTKKEAVNEALREYVNKWKRIQAIDEFHSFDFDPEYDYKVHRE